jgi:hypothetical protein
VDRAEDRLGRKHGIDLKVVYAGRMRPQQLLMSGDVAAVIATCSGGCNILKPNEAIRQRSSMLRSSGSSSKAALSRGC